MLTAVTYAYWVQPLQRVTLVLVLMTLCLRWTIGIALVILSSLYLNEQVGKGYAVLLYNISQAQVYNCSKLVTWNSIKQHNTTIHACAYNYWMVFDHHYTTCLSFISTTFPKSNINKYSLWRRWVCLQQYSMHSICLGVWWLGWLWRQQWWGPLCRLV